jgi:drug/metabolite transporter superfamily protein YnfA
MTSPEQPIDDAPDPILPLVRTSVWALLILAAANGAYLYFFPSQAEPHYAWPVAPPATAAFMGAGYLAGLVAAYLTIFRARYWRSVYSLTPAFITLSLALLVATLIHADRFRWSFLPTWIWTAVYVGIPVAASLLWRLQARANRDRPTPDPRTRTLRGLALIAGAGVTTVGLVLFIAPDGLTDDWPWTLTDLTSRVLGGWYLLSGVLLLVVGTGLRRWHEFIVPFATVGTWTALIMLLPALYDEIDAGDGALAAWFALHATLLALCAYGLIRTRQATRQPGEFGM